MPDSSPRKIYSFAQHTKVYHMNMLNIVPADYYSL